MTSISVCVHRVQRTTTGYLTLVSVTSKLTACSIRRRAEQCVCRTLRTLLSFCVRAWHCLAHGHDLWDATGYSLTNLDRSLGASCTWARTWGRISTRLCWGSGCLLQGSWWCSGARLWLDSRLPGFLFLSHRSKGTGNLCILMCRSKVWVNWASTQGSKVHRVYRW